MPRKIGTFGESKIGRGAKNAGRKIETIQKIRGGEKARPARQKSAGNLPDAIGRPPPPGEGKRGEQGYLAYLLRQAQAATRLTMERALADLGVTPPQFVVLTMLKAYPGPVGRRSRPGGAADPADRRRHHPQPGTRRRDPKDPAPGPRPGAAMDADAARRTLARQMPASRQGGGAAAGGRALRQGAGHGAALARPKSPQICSR